MIYLIVFRRVSGALRKKPLLNCSGRSLEIFSMTRTWTEPWMKPRRRGSTGWVEKDLSLTYNQLYPLLCLTLCVQRAGGLFGNHVNPFSMERGTPMPTQVTSQRPLQIADSRAEQTDASPGSPSYLTHTNFNNNNTNDNRSRRR